MAHFEQGSNQTDETDNPEFAARRARYGLVLFFLYLALYAGFMGLSAFHPGLMESTPIGGVNLAILYGFVLIVAALGLALVYAWLCRR